MRGLAWTVSIVWLLAPFAGCLELTVPGPEHTYQNTPASDAHKPDTADTVVPTDTVEGDGDTVSVPTDKGMSLPDLEEDGILSAPEVNDVLENPPDDECEPYVGSFGGDAADPTECWQKQAVLAYPDPATEAQADAWHASHSKGEALIKEGSALGPTCYEAGGGGKAGVFLRNFTQHQAHYRGSLVVYLDGEKSGKTQLSLSLGSDFEWMVKEEEVGSCDAEPCSASDVCKEVDAVGADGAKGYQCMGIDSDNGPKLTINHQGQGPNGGEPYYYVTVSDTGGENIEEGQFAKTEYAGTWMRVEWEVDRRNDPVTLSLWLISMGKAVNGEIPTNNTPDSPPEVLFDVTDVAMSGSSNFATAPWVYVGGKGCIGEVAWYRRRNLCSNGKVDGDESCDDGNFASDDGCSSSCETEANGDKLGFYKSCSEFEDTGGTGHTWIDPDLLTQDEANETEGRRVLCTDGWMEIAKNTGSTHFVSEHYLHGYRTLDPPDGNTESYVHPCTFVEAALGASTPQEIVVRLEMGGLVDYFRPTSDSSLCQMLSGYEHHDWYGDPGGLEDPGEIPAWFKAPAAEETWVDGDFTSTRHLGGSGHLDEQEGGWSTTGTGRDRLSFWGGDISPGGVFYGGCEEGGGMPFQIYKEQPFVLSAKNLDEGETVPESGCSGELNSP